MFFERTHFLCIKKVKYPFYMAKSTSYFELQRHVRLACKAIACAEHHDEIVKHAPDVFEAHALANARGDHFDVGSKDTRLFIDALARCRISAIGVKEGSGNPKRSKAAPASRGRRRGAAVVDADDDAEFVTAFDELPPEPIELIISDALNPKDLSGGAGTEERTFEREAGTFSPAQPPDEILDKATSSQLRSAAGSPAGARLMLGVRHLFGLATSNPAFSKAAATINAACSFIRSPDARTQREPEFVRAATQSTCVFADAAMSFSALCMESAERSSGLREGEFLYDPRDWLPTELLRAATSSIACLKYGASLKCVVAVPNDSVYVEITTLVAEYVSTFSKAMALLETRVAIALSSAAASSLSAPDGPRRPLDGYAAALLEANRLLSQSLASAKAAESKLSRLAKSPESVELRALMDLGAPTADDDNAHKVSFHATLASIIQQARDYASWSARSLSFSFSCLVSALGSCAVFYARYHVEVDTARTLSRVPLAEVATAAVASLSDSIRAGVPGSTLYEYTRSIILEARERAASAAASNEMDIQDNIRRAIQSNIVERFAASPPSGALLSVAGVPLSSIVSDRIASEQLVSALASELAPTLPGGMQSGVLKRYVQQVVYSLERKSSSGALKSVASVLAPGASAESLQDASLLLSAITASGGLLYAIYRARTRASGEPVSKADVAILAGTGLASFYLASGAFNISHCLRALRIANDIAYSATLPELVLRLSGSAFKVAAGWYVMSLIFSNVSFVPFWLAGFLGNVSVSLILMLLSRVLTVARSFILPANAQAAAALLPRDPPADELDASVTALEKASASLDSLVRTLQQQAA